MNIFRKFFDIFKKKEEVKKEDEVWFNQSAQKGEVHVSFANPECPSLSENGRDASIAESLTNSSC